MVLGFPHEICGPPVNLHFNQSHDPYGLQVLKLHVPSNTARENFTHFTVYTRSMLVEQLLGQNRELLSLV